MGMTNTTATLIRVSCTCTAPGCQGVVIELPESKLAFARTARERRTMIHNYVQGRNGILGARGIVRTITNG